MPKTLSSPIIRGAHLIALLAFTALFAQAKGVIKERYIVTFETTVADPAATGQQLSQIHGFKMRNVYHNALHGMLIEVPPAAGPALANALRRNPLIRSVVQDRQVTLTAQTKPKGVRRVAAELGIGIRANAGTGIDVAVMDSGIDSTHRDLNVDTTRNATCIDGNPCITGPGTGEDAFGHGTSVAGAIAALDNSVDLVGVAPSVNLISVQVFDSNGESSNGDIIAGIDYLLTLNHTNLVEVVNMSFRDICTDTNGANAPCAGNPDIQPLETALQNLANSGTTTVAAAGNDAIDTKYVMPASSNAVIAVSAMADSNGLPGGGGAKVCVSRLGNFCLQTTPDDSFAPFSNFGSAVAVTAPGTDELLLAKGGGTSKASGTSFAAPYAAGVAAIFIRDRLNRGEATPSPGKVKKALIQTGECYQKGSGAGFLFYGTTGCPSKWPGDSDGTAEPLVRADNIANFVAPTPVHDVAVTSVQPPPAPVPINSPKTVVVNVTNQGTEKETFNVRLTDNLASTISGVQSVTLNDGASASLTFSWTPATRGNHVLTATADTVPNESDTADNVKSTACMVTDVVVTEVDAPVFVVRGDTANVAVSVQNLANVTEAVTVTIIDTPPSGGTAGSASCPSALVLAAGATTIFNCSWNTAGASIGAHTLIVTASNGVTSHSVTVTPIVFIPGAAGFVSSDSKTQGTWKGVYGAQGLAIANDVTNYPTYAQVALSGQTSATWAASTTDVRALQKGAPTATDRIASTWTSTTSFSINLDLIDGNWHRVALYCLDWDNRGRAERIDVLDKTTNSVLDSRSLSGFVNGTYLVWNLKGGVRIQVTLTAGDNAVVSGLFFDPPAPPDFALSASPSSQTMARGDTGSYTVTVTPSLGFSGSVSFNASGLPSGATASFSPTSTGSGSSTMTVTVGSTTPLGSYPLTLTGTSGSLSHSVMVTLVVATAVPAVAFVRTDTQTQGTWKGVYGTDGFAIPNDSTNYPSYAQVTLNNALSVTWVGSTTDVRALQKGAATATDRIASTWVSNTSFSIDLSLGDGNWHQVALYCLDWDNRSRVERIDILDSATGNVLDSRTISSFTTGQYLVWNLRGNIKIQVTRTSGDNAVVSGLFFDFQAPTSPGFTLSATPSSQTVGQGNSTTYNLAVISSFGFSGAVSFSASGLPSGATASFSPTSVTGSGSSTMTVTAGSTTPIGSYPLTLTGTSGSLSHFVTVNLVVVIPGVATFVTTDLQTQGTWKGVYGTDGFGIPNDFTNYPSYAQVTFNNTLSVTWVGSTTDVRALQKGAATATDRIASTWVSNTSFSIDLSLADGNWHKVALYCLDWDNRSRVERIDILDAATNSVLDSRNVSAFTNGQYLIWNLRGNLKVQVTRTSGDNAVVSGLFFN
jgi:subtilisin